jgi:hypothetical protein
MVSNRFNNIIVFLAIIILSGSCRKSTGLNEKQDILFQVDYLNYSLGFEHRGLYIDKTGEVFSYNNPEDWNFTDDDMTISGEQMRNNIKKCKVSPNPVNSDEMMRHTAHIRNISSSKVTAQKNVAADAGTLLFICYTYSEKSDTYKGTIVKMEGNFTSENLNFYSKKLVAWLRSVSESLKVTK